MPWKSRLKLVITVILVTLIALLLVLMKLGVTGFSFGPHGIRLIHSHPVPTPAVKPLLPPGPVA
jgi:hypothetical protein